MIKRVLLLIVAMLLAVSFLYADTLTLKDGKQIEGKILERGNDSVKIDIAGVEVTYFNDEIDKINDENITVPVDKINLEVKKEVVEITPGSASESSLKIEARDSGDTAEANIDLTVPGRKSQFRLSVPSQTPPQFTKEQAKVALILVIISLIIVLIGYIYTALCLYLIAKKTAKDPAWMAWIPIANLFLMCKIGSVSYWFLLILLLGAIPFAGFLFVIGFSGFVWYKIALERGKDGWIGILTCIPLIGLITMGYLAFSD
ncbi:MAG: hypothetical protein KJ880_04065 [Candidatus Omnitrophica bacterium]|nr:hypothetical protein [Candidatus Omnitrophota bacterium]MBU1869855.1 hypothetical protein [Candidatus Omnitrophota bacterium]